MELFGKVLKCTPEDKDLLASLLHTSFSIFFFAKKIFCL